MSANFSLHRERRVWPALQFSCSPTVVALVAAAFIVLTGNVALWRTVQTVMPFSAATIGFWLAELLLLMALVHLLIALTAFRYVFKAVLVLLFFTTAIAAYFMSTYGSLIDSSMIQNVAETDLAEAADLLTGSLLLHLLLLGLLPSIALSRVRIQLPSPTQHLLRQIAMVLLSLLVAGVALASHYKEFSLIGRTHKELRMQMNPIYPLYAISQYALSSVTGPRAVQPLAEDAHRLQAVGNARRRLLLVLVVGETARAANFSLNGYGRETNPELSQLPLLNFRDTSACGTSTAISVRCMFSNLGRARFDREQADHQQSVLDVLQRTGVSVLWRDNNSGCKGTCDRIVTPESRWRQDAELCTGNECFDGVLLNRWQTDIAAQAGDTLLVLHQQGSHGPAYYKRSPPAYKRFLPECTDANVQNCERDSIINAYDNSIVYTDHVLASLIKQLQQSDERYDSAVIYLSDHGESLGENALYLHGLPYLLAPAEQKQVPLLMWLSPGFAERLHIDMGCMTQRANAPASHDNLFHTLLGAFDVQTQAYQHTLDLFAECRGAGGSVHLAGS